MLIHPAHGMPFAELMQRLRTARDNRHVYERRGPDGLVLYVYTEHCVFDEAWDEVTMAARGLIVDEAAGRIVATPFPKFFNAGERGGDIPDLPFQTMEKLDGSLIIIFQHRAKWRTITKGAFDSWQAKWAQEVVEASDQSQLEPGVTYLAEGLHPDNRIVVRYTEPELVLLAAYDARGVEVAVDALQPVARAIGWRLAKRHDFGSMAELMAHTKGLPRSEEGYVVRFENGLRLKLKGDEYKRIHALISRITPLAMWEAMVAGDDLDKIRRDIPEEFSTDFDAIIGLLDAALKQRIAKVGAAAAQLAHLSDKDIGLNFQEIDPEVRPFVFAYRKSGGNLLDAKSRSGLFRAIRPTGNLLAGYTPSYAMNRLADDL